MRSDVVIFGGNDPSTLDWIVGVAGLLAATATTLGVMFAVFQYARSLSDTRKAQARLVHAIFEVTWPTVSPAGQIISRTRTKPTEMPTEWVTVSLTDDVWTITATTTVIRWNLKVKNNSEEVVTSIRGRISHKGQLIGDALETVLWLEPGEDETLLGWGPWVETNDSKDAEPTICFQDAAGHWWVRHLSRPVEPLSNRDRERYWSGPDVVW